ADELAVSLCGDWYAEADDWWAAFYAPNYNFMANYEVMQFTGLKDKNGVEIYEGDRITGGVWGGAGYYYTDKFTVDFIDGCFCAVQKRKPLNATCLDKIDHRKVIGNIYKNPKLLEVKK
ncbi:hypothetical protein LCGC14_1578070, partial [marine sediment metagenome]